jgi:hypothetical protein
VYEHVARLRNVTPEDPDPRFQSVDEGAAE